MNSGEKDSFIKERRSLQRDIFEVRTRPLVFRGLPFTRHLGESVPRKSSIRNGSFEKIARIMGEIIADDSSVIQLKALKEYSIPYRKISASGVKDTRNKGRYLYVGSLVGLTENEELESNPGLPSEYPLLHIKQGYTPQPAASEEEDIYILPFITLPDFITKVKTETIGMKLGKLSSDTF